MAEEELDDDALQPSGMRPFWSGTITFGLVTVPVALYAATRQRGVALRMLGPDEAPVQRRYVCSKDGKPLDADDIVRGYEVEKGHFVVVTEEELEAVEPRKSREIDLQLFVDLDDIEPLYYERAYYLVPIGGTNKAYRLLAEVMEKKRQAGLATFVMRAKEYMVAIIAENGILRAETLRFASDIRKPEDVGLPEPAKVPAAEVKKIENQIARHAKKFDMHELLDDYSERLEKLVAKKEKNHAAVVSVAEDTGTDDTSGGEVIDLMAALSKSLQQGARRAPKKAPVRRKKPAATAAKKK